MDEEELDDELFTIEYDEDIEALNQAYWRGIRDAVIWFRDNLQFESAEDTDLAEWAREELGDNCFEPEVDD